MMKTIQKENSTIITIQQKNQKERQICMYYLPRVHPEK
jgi:hypothetical protein